MPLGPDLRHDEAGQGISLAVPFLLAIILIIVGVLLIQGQSYGTGLILVGIGLLIGGFGGRATLGYGMLKIVGPVGLILIVVGTAVRIIFGR